MKAAVFWEIGKPMVVEDLTLDAPGPGEVRVEIAACAVCHSDLTFLEGGWPDRLPVVYGHEAVGTVEAVGTDVVTARVGERVLVTLLRSCGECHCCRSDAPYLCGSGHRLDAGSHLRTATGTAVKPGIRTGAFAEAVVVDQSQVVVIPEDIPSTSASLLSCGVITGFGAVTRSAEMPAGADAVVIGVGGVGLNCVQAAAIGGARTVIAVDLSAEKRAAAHGFGATHALDPMDGDLVAAIRDLTEGRGASHVFVAVGAHPAIRQGLDMLGVGGTLVLVGMPAQDLPLETSPLDLVSYGKRIVGSKMGSTVLRRDIPLLVDLYRSGRLKLDELVSETFPLERINDAVAATKAGRGLRNVVVM